MLTAPSGCPQAPRRAVSEARRSIRRTGVLVAMPAGDLLDRVCDRVEAVAAGSALAHALAGHPARQARDFGHGAGAL